MVYLKEVICHKASVFLGWDRLAHRISVKLSVQDYNLAEVVGRCNVFFVTHVVVLHSKESLDPIIIGDFGGGSGMGNMKTFPHHLHLGSEKNASECREVFVEDVLNEMKTIIRLECADSS